VPETTSKPWEFWSVPVAPETGKLVLARAFGAHMVPQSSVGGPFAARPLHRTRVVRIVDRGFMTLPSNHVHDTPLGLEKYNQQEMSGERCEKYDTTLQIKQKMLRNFWKEHLVHMKTCAIKRINNRDTNPMRHRSGINMRDCDKNTVNGADLLAVFTKWSVEKTLVYPYRMAGGRPAMTSSVRCCQAVSRRLEVMKLSVTKNW